MLRLGTAVSEVDARAGASSARCLLASVPPEPIGESDSLLLEEIEGKQRLYTTLAQSVPRGENRRVDAGHVTMHLRRPDTVIQAIQDLVGRAGT